MRRTPFWMALVMVVAGAGFLSQLGPAVMHWTGGVVPRSHDHGSDPFDPVGEGTVHD